MLPYLIKEVINPSKGYTSYLGKENLQVKKLDFILFFIEIHDNSCCAYPNKQKATKRVPKKRPLVPLMVVLKVVFVAGRQTRHIESPL